MNLLQLRPQNKSQALKSRPLKNQHKNHQNLKPIRRWEKEAKTTDRDPRKEPRKMSPPEGGSG